MKNTLTVLSLLFFTAAASAASSPIVLVKQKPRPDFMTDKVRSNAVTLIVHPGDVAKNPDFTFYGSIQPTREPDVAKSVLEQSKLGEHVMLWIGSKEEPEVVNNYPKFLAEAKKYPNIEWVYIIDEFFWDKNGFNIGKYEKEMIEAAHMAHAQGLKTSILTLPDVILRPDFRLDQINVFDMIGIDAYPGVKPSDPIDYKGCRYSDNETANRLYCAAKKLRSLGYTGAIGYAYQAFSFKWVPHDVLIAQLKEQREVLDEVQFMGVDVVTPWGLYLSQQDMDNEPGLFQFAGTEYEHLVAPPK